MRILGDRAPTAQRRIVGWFTATMPAHIFDGPSMGRAALMEFGGPLHSTAAWAKTAAQGRTGRQCAASNEGTSVTDLPLGHGADPSAAEFAVRDVPDRTSSEVASDPGCKASAGFCRDSGTASESARGIATCTTDPIGGQQAHFALDWTLSSEFQKHLARALLSNYERSVSKLLVASDTPPGFGGCQRPLGSHEVDLGFDSPKRRVPFDLEALRIETDGAGQAVLHGKHATAN